MIDVKLQFPEKRKKLPSPLCFYSLFSFLNLNLNFSFYFYFYLLFFPHGLLPIVKVVEQHLRFLTIVATKTLKTAPNSKQAVSIMHLFY